MNKYTELYEKRKSLLNQAKDIEVTLQCMRDEYTEKAREQNWAKIHSITDEEKRILLKFVEHEGGSCKLNGASAWRECFCPRCRLEEIFEEGENYYGKDGFTIHAEISAITWEDYKEE